LLAPVQALTALFVPAQSASACTRPAVDPALACRTPAASCKTLKLDIKKTVRKSTPDAPVRRLKIVRQFEPGANRSCAGRLVISGRMSDVCAELERMAG
jgi:hypothetical protein